MNLMCNFAFNLRDIIYSINGERPQVNLMHTLKVIQGKITIFISHPYFSYEIIQLANVNPSYSIATDSACAVDISMLSCVFVV